MSQSTFLRRGLPALAVLGISAPAWAQTTLYTFNGTKQYDRLGAAVGSAGDTNMDGKPDIVVGAPEDYQIFFSEEGFIRIYSGANGSVLQTVNGDFQYDEFGWAVAGIGDINNDGRSDVVVGAPSASPMTSLQGLARVVSGANGSTLLSVYGMTSWQLGWSVASAGDVNGDGKPDFLAGAPEATVNGNGSGTARVYSGLDGAVIWSFPGSASNKRRGYSVAGLGDSNGDGRADVIIGSLFDGVKVYSGMTASTLLTFTGGSTDYLGKSVCSIADITGDGKREIVIGATQEDVFSPGTGFVKVYNGVSGALLWTATGIATGDRFGHRVSDAGDWDGSGTTDVIVSANPSDGNVQSYARILSGVNGSILATLYGTSPSDDFGYDVAGLGDVNANGSVDVAVGAPLASPMGLGSGYARVIQGMGGTGCTGGTSNYCMTSPNSVGSGSLISSSGSTSIATNNLVLIATGCPHNQFGIFYYGSNQIQQPFGNGFRCVGAGGGSVWRLPVITTSSQGIGTFAVNYNSVPNGGTILPFSNWNFQFWYRDPAAGGANFNFSNGLNAQFCP